VTVLFAAVVEKPAPVTRSVVDVMGCRLAGIAATEGMTLPTTTGAPLDSPKDVTTAASEPVFGSGHVNESVSDVGDATETQ